MRSQIYGWFNKLTIAWNDVEDYLEIVLYFSPV